MDFETYLGSNYQLPVQVTGEIMPPISSDILYQDGMLSHNVVASHMDSSFGILSSPTVAASLSTQFISNDMNHGILMNNPYFEANMETNALINNFRSSPVQNGYYRTNSNVNLPSFSSATNSSMRLDHLLVPHQLSQAVQYQTEQNKTQHKQFSVPSPLPQAMVQANQASGPLSQFDESTQAQKKPRLESKRDDIFLQNMIQQLLFGETSNQFMSHDLKVASPMQYQVLNALHRETAPSLPKSIEAHCQQLLTHPSMTNHHKQVPERQVSQIPLINGDACAARLTQYLHHQRNRPKQNNIAYWRQFIAKFFAFDAKKRWCFSNYDHLGHGSFSPAVLGSWDCEICGAKSGRGFEATFEVLPRLCKVNFEGGVMDKLLFLDSPCERKLPLGRMLLQYTKAVQETVYKNSRIIHEGQLRVIFTKELKIMSWEFCARCHEEFVPRRLIAPQVNQMIQAAQKCQGNIEHNKSDGGPRQSSQATHNRFVKAGNILAKTLDSQIVSEYGFSKPLVRFFQTTEVVNSMKDLMTYGLENNLSPIESLKRYAQETKLKYTQMFERAPHQEAQVYSSTENKLRLSSASTQYQTQFDESLVLNSGAEANDRWSSTAETNYHQGLLLGNANSKGTTSVNKYSQEPNNSSFQAGRKLVRWNSVSSSSASIIHPLNSTGNLSTISFTQGDQDPRKYVLNKLMIEKIFSSGPQPPTAAPQLEGMNETSSKGTGGSQRKSVRKRVPVKGPRSSSQRAQSSSMLKRPIKKEMDMLEDDDVPILPGVRVKKEVFYG